MSNNKVEFIISAKDQASQVIKNVDKGVQEMSGNIGKSFNNLVGPSAAFLGVLTAAGAGLTILAKNGLTAAADLETAQIGLTTLLGNADEAAQTIERIKVEAARTPFELVGLSQAVQLLSSVTKDGNKAVDVVLDVGEGLAAMGKGQPELDRIIVNLQQIAAVGKASTLDIKQFAFAGIPIYEMLTEQTGLAGEALGDLITNGGVSFDLLTDMFDKANDEGGKFFNAYKNQAGSFNQSLSNMKDSVTIFLSELVKQTGLFDLMKTVFQTVTDSLPKIMTAMQTLATVLKENPNLIIGIAAAITTALIPVLYTAAVAMLPFLIASAELILISAAVGAAVYLLAQAWTTNFLGIRDIVNAVWNGIVAAFTGIIEASVFLYTQFGIVKDKTVEIWGSIIDWLVNAFNSVISTITSIWSGITGFFETLWNGIVALFQFQIALAVGIVIFAFNAMGIDIVTVFTNIVNGLVIFWEATKLMFSTALGFIQELWSVSWGIVESVAITIWSAITSEISKAWGIIKGLVNTGMNWILGVFKTLSEPIKLAWGSMWESLSGTAVSVWETVKGTIVASLNFIIDKINAVINMANKVAAMGAGAIGINIVQLPTLPRFAHGGMVSALDGGLVQGKGGLDTIPAMLSAGEVVLNAAQQQNVARGLEKGGGTTIQVVIEGNNFYGDDATFSEKIGKTIVDELKLHTSIQSFA